MKAVIAELPRHWGEERRNSEASQWDEMWDGVLHMAPMPNGMHQDFALDLAAYLKRRWAKPRGGLVRLEANLTTLEDESDWTKNYRIPDIVLVSKDRLGIDKNTYLAGAPLVVVEIRSYGDETDEKFEFYSGLGVPEVWTFDRDSKAIELFLRSSDGSYELVRPDAEGWHRSPNTGASFRQVERCSIFIRVDNDPDSERELPDE